VTAPFHGRTALVVDDSPAMRRHIGATLRSIGFETHEAEHGAEAWRRLQGLPADLVVTDINMPVMDGLKLIGLIRAALSHRRTPIVVISSESTVEDRRRAVHLGASEYLLKPVQSEQVVEAVRRLLAPRPPALPARGRAMGRG
jgi:two-component system, chemotaxis family, chemotaxis protein CheY